MPGVPKSVFQGNIIQTVLHRLNTKFHTKNLVLLVVCQNIAHIGAFNRLQLWLVTNHDET